MDCRTENMKAWEEAVICFLFTFSICLGTAGVVYLLITLYTRQ